MSSIHNFHSWLGLTLFFCLQLQGRSKDTLSCSTCSVCVSVLAHSSHKECETENFIAACLQHNLQKPFLSVFVFAHNFLDSSHKCETSNFIGPNRILIACLHMKILVHWISLHLLQFVPGKVVLETTDIVTYSLDSAGNSTSSSSKVVRCEEHLLSSFILPDILILATYSFGIFVFVRGESDYLFGLASHVGWIIRTSGPMENTQFRVWFFTQVYFSFYLVIILVCMT